MFGNDTGQRLARIEEQLGAVQGELRRVHEEVAKQLDTDSNLVLRVSHLEWQVRAVGGIMAAVLVAGGPVLLDHYLDRAHRQSQSVTWALLGRPAVLPACSPHMS